MRILFPVLLLLLALSSFVPLPKTGTVRLVFIPQYQGRPLQLGTQLYHNAKGDSFYVDALRFYLSAFKLEGPRRAFSEPNSYHLLDGETPEKFVFDLENVPEGRYRNLHFAVGTDSLVNVSGAMGGDLDPTLGMYWAWNSGYINVKIEGRSNSCKTVHHAFEFHLGGYMPPNQTYRELNFPLKSFVVKKNKTTEIQVNIDLARFFDRIALSQSNQIMSPSKAAAEMADVFREVFFLE